MNIELWKLWEAYYGHKTKLGRTLINMQQAQFDFECMGVRITKKQLKRMKPTHDKEDFPVLYPGTTEQDYAKAKWILGRSSTLYGDLDQFCQGTPENDIFDNCGSGFHKIALMQYTETFISKHANELQHAFLNVSLDASSNLNLS